MKSKILSLVLSIELCSSIFGIKITNNTNSTLKIATQMIVPKGQSKLTYYIGVNIKPGESKSVEPFNKNGKIALKFDVNYFASGFYAPFSNNNITITEQDKTYIITEKFDEFDSAINYIIEKDKAKNIKFIEEIDISDRQMESNYCSKKIFILCSSIAIAILVGYFTSFY